MADRYVALSSSFAAGPGVGRRRPGSPRRAGRSASNYAGLFAARTGLALRFRPAARREAAETDARTGERPDGLAATFDRVLTEVRRRPRGPGGATCFPPFFAMVRRFTPTGPACGRWPI
jgi:hypothetical protein